MRKLLLTLIHLGIGVFLGAQNNSLDSLETRFAAENESGQRLELLKQMTDLAYLQNFELALSYAKRGVALAEEVNATEWLPQFQESKGRMHANLGQLDSATLFFNKALEGYTAIGNQKGQATTSFKIAWVHQRKGEYEQALKVNLSALRIMEELGDQEGIAGALGRVSEDFYNQGQYKESLNYAQQAVDICRKNELQSELPYALRAACYASLALKEHEQALKYADEALAMMLAEGTNLSGIADMSNARGNSLKRLKRYTEAIEEYERCLANSEKASYPGGILASTGNIGEVYLLLENYENALPYQLRTIQLQEELGAISNLVENYTHASTIYEQLGDYKSALAFQKKARIMRDSTASMQSNEAMLELRTQYETEKKEATIQLQEAQLMQQRQVQWLTIGIAALLGLFAFSFYRNAINRKKTNALLSAQNAEKALLLKEIHHRVKNNLEVVSSLLALQSAQIDDPNIKDAMQEGQNRVQSIGIVHQKLYQGENLAAIDMKDYFVNLSESILDSFGAEDRVKIECAMDQLELDIDTAVPLGLIVNELLTNALKYAFPDGREGQIKIELTRKAETLYLKVADNGVGKSGLVHGTGFGGQLVSLLTRQLNGSMREAAEGGTNVFFDFKLQKVA